MSICAPARTTTVSWTAIGASSGAGGSRYTVASPCTLAPASSVPSLTTYETVPSRPAAPSAVVPETRRWFCPTASTESVAPSSARAATSLSSSTRRVGFETASKTSSVASCCGCTNATTGEVASCAGASAGSRVMRAVPVASLTPSDTVKSTRNVPGCFAVKSNDVEPPTTVAVAAASSSTRTEPSDSVPAVPVTWSATSTVRADATVSVTANDCAASCGWGDTFTISGFTAVCPWVSATVTASSMSSSPPSPASLCW